MRALVALVVVALVGLAVDAQIAAAGSPPLKKPNPGVSVDAGPVSVTADASTDGAGASVDVSTPAVSVEAAVDPSSPATVDVSTPVAGASAHVAAPTGQTPHATAKALRPLSSARLRAPAKSVAEPVQVTHPVVTGGMPVTTEPARVRPTPTISTPVRRVRTAVERASTGGSPKPAVARPHAAKKAPQSPLLAPNAVSTLSPVAGALETAPAATVTHRLRGSAPGPASGGSGGGVLGGGISPAGPFVILSALLMLAAPVVGRWLRPAIGMALQPAFASLPERPG
jgi:hypothetical protein